MGVRSFLRVALCIYCEEVVTTVGVLGFCPLSGWWGVEGMGFFNGLWVFKRVSKIALGNMVWLSFKWLLAVKSAWM